MCITLTIQVIIFNLWVLSVQAISLSQMISKKSKLLTKEVFNSVVAEDSIESLNQEDTLLSVPSQLLNPYRLLILTALWRGGGLDFKTLKAGTHVKSDGNLASHLRVLEDVGVIEYKKEFVDRRPKTFYKLTNKGKKELLELVKAITASLSEIE